MKYLSQINATTIPTLVPVYGKVTSISSLINLIFPLAIVGAALIFLVTTLYGAFTWLTAGSETKNVQKAQKIFIFSILGLVIVIVSYVAVKLIGVILNINLPL